MEEAQHRLTDCCDFSLGITPYDKYRGQDPELIKSRGYHSIEKLDENYKPLIDGGDVDRYVITTSNKEYIKYGEWLGAMREERFFVEPHIVVRQIVNQRIFAGYTEGGLYNTQIGFNLVAKEGWNLKYILAILNSEILNEYHTKKFLDQTKNLFQKILIANAKQLPIPVATPEQQTQIAELVDQIMEKKVELSSFIKNTFQLWENEFKQKITLNSKLKEFWKLEVVEFINLIEKQKIPLDREQKRLAIRDFESDKQAVLIKQKNIDKIDAEIEELVRVLYGVEKAD